MPFLRDRIEEADRGFFERVAKGYHAIAAAEPERVKAIDGSGSVTAVSTAVWQAVQPLLARV
jgi:thymidylate kinase